MPAPIDSPPGFFARVRRWFMRQIVEEVPAESAVCEFDCRKQQCRFEEWATCERRLAYAERDQLPNKSQDKNP